MSKNLSELSGRKGLQHNLFDKMGQLAIDTETPSVEELEKLADEFLIGTANTYGATTFYDFLRPENKGKKVYLCNGSVCLCAGTQDALHKTLSSHFKEEEIGEMCCLGRCHENAAFQYQGNNYSGLNAGQIAEVLEKKTVRPDRYQVSQKGKAVLTAPAPDLESLKERLQSIAGDAPDSALAQIDASGIRGRGGAGFPMARKLAFAKAAPGDVKFIICNADEGDPGAFSDRYLLEERPQLVLFGMLVAGFVIGAKWGVLYIRGEYPESVEAIEKAVQEFEQSGINQLFDFQWKVIKAQGSYICGEETALINSIEGQRPEVRVRPPYPAVSGLFNKPTVVNNVETLAALYYIMEQGGEAYAGLGTDQSSGTKLLSLDSHFNRPGIVEVEMGTPLSSVVEELGGGFRKPVKAMHIGGPLGGLVPVQKIGDLTVDFESFAKNGFLLGHASIVCIPETMPLVAYLEHLFAFAAHESCGKCFPCRLGTKRAEELFRKAQQDSSFKIDGNLIDDLLHTLETGSLCAHGGGIPLPVRNALQYFDEELRTFFS